MARLTTDQVKSIAHQIKEACEKYGWKYDVRGEVLTIHKYFTPGDLDGFRDADMEYYSIIGLLPRSRAGSDWGTEGVGSFVAHENGHFVMNRSGGNLNVLKCLAKL